MVGMGTEEEELLFTVRLLMACLMWPLYLPEMVDMLKDKLISTGIWG